MLTFQCSGPDCDVPWRFGRCLSDSRWSLPVVLHLQLPPGHHSAAGAGQACRLQVRTQRRHWIRFVTRLGHSLQLAEGCQNDQANILRVNQVIYVQCDPFI